MSREPIDLTEARATITKAADERSESLPGLIQAHYPSLLALAKQIYAKESKGHSLSPTILVHEAYLRLVDQPKITSRGKNFFRACFAQECRRILVDHARRRNALRRGGALQRESFGDQSGLGISGELDLVEINEAIEGLAKMSPRVARVADMRLFCAMTVAECADALEVGPRTIDKEWALARSWLQKELE